MVVKDTCRVSCPCFYSSPWTYSCVDRLLQPPPVKHTYYMFNCLHSITYILVHVKELGFIDSLNSFREKFRDFSTQLLRDVETSLKTMLEKK